MICNTCRNVRNKMLAIYEVSMEHSPIRQTFKFENNFSTVGKSFLNLVKLRSLVAKYCTMLKIWSCKACEFSILLYYAGKSVTTFPHRGNAFPFLNTKVYKIRKLYRTIFSTLYNILQPNFTISLNLGRSFPLC